MLLKDLQATYLSINCSRLSNKPLKTEDLKTLVDFLLFCKLNQRLAISYWMVLFPLLVDNRVESTNPVECDAYLFCFPVLSLLAIKLGFSPFANCEPSGLYTNVSPMFHSKVILGLLEVFV